MKKLSRKNITPQWFYSEPGVLLRCLLIFIKGDALFILPLVVVILLTTFISLRFMLLILGSFLTLRFFGEMIYWLLQQFGEKEYRPHDLGFTNLKNNEIYILYQTFSLAFCMIGIGIVFYVLLFWK
jgi:hypothetical protein